MPADMKNAVFGLCLLYVVYLMTIQTERELLENLPTTIKNRAHRARSLALLAGIAFALLVYYTATPSAPP
jgi:hypothetical protein